MIWKLGMLAAVLAVGGVVGFALGTESQARCVECIWSSEGQYRRGMEDGWTDCAVQLAGMIRQRAVEAKNTWTITKTELDRIEKELSEHDPE